MKPKYVQTSNTINWLLDIDSSNAIDLINKPGKSIFSYSRINRRKNFLASVGLFIFTFSFLVTEASAQIVPDATLPVNSQVTPNGNIWTIEGGTTTGGNLYHSFQEFSIPTDGEAFFNNAANIQNIFTRVTGSYISNIDGLIRANGTANLFLLNPNGIIFGPRAKLDIGGSFLASTASSMKFADGSFFSASNPQANPLLTVSVPVGLQTGPNPGTIEVQGQGQNLFGVSEGGGAAERFDRSLNPFLVEVKDGKTLGLLGGNVIVKGGILQAPGGRVELGGLLGEGTVKINDDGSFNFPEGVARADVSITDKSGINVIGSGGGSITITAGNLNILGESLLSAGIAENAGSLESFAGNIAIGASGGITISSSRIENNVNFGASGNSGNIDINAGAFFLIDKAEIDSSNSGVGNAGNVSIATLNDVNIQNSTVSSDAYAENNSGGTAGFVYISGDKSVNIANSQITAESYNDSTITANTDEQNDFFGTGNIWINGGSIALDGVTLSSALQGSGFAGNIYLIATDDINIGNESSIISDAYDEENTSFGGTAGTVYITAGKSFNLTANSSITADSFSSNDSGFGGLIYIEAPTVNLSDKAALSTDTYGFVRAGDITINATETFSISNSTISSQGIGPETGSAGNITIYGSKQVSIDNSSINNASESNGFNGDYGSITIRASEGSLLLDGVTVSSTNKGSGLAGDIILNARDRVEINQSTIASNGNFGRIFIGESGEDSFSPRVAIVNASKLTTNNDASQAAEDVQIDAGFISIDAIDRVSLVKSSSLETFTSRRGNAGSVTINSQGEVSLEDGSSIFSTVEEGGVGNGGSIDLVARSLSLNDGAQLQTLIRSQEEDPTGERFAGNITITTTGDVSFDGFSTTDLNGNTDEFPSGVFSTVEQDAIGNAGNIRIEARSIRLNNQATIKASTASGTGGNVTLQSQDILLLRDNSTISTTAGSDRTEGKGGNITISNTYLFSLGNSDITANAFQGQGGNISINSQGIFGAQKQTREQLEDLLGNLSNLDNLDEQLQSLPSSDITALSQQGGPELEGSVEINSSGINPAEGLVQLETNPVDPSNLIAQTCRAGSSQASLSITGKGGLPPSPNESISDDATWIDLRPATGEQRSRGESRRETKIPYHQIIEARGWAIDSNGVVNLVVQPSTATPQTSASIQSRCGAP